MKREYIIAFGETWYHFYVCPNQGFCVGKKQGARFSFSHSLLKDAISDFSVTRAGKSIHAVCQDKKGAIWHFLFDGTKWHSRILLESREKSAQHKNLTLVAKDAFVNLFYTISVKEQTMLVHQLLGSGAKDPQVVDYTTKASFSVCTHANGDATVLYKNAEGVLGTKRYRWSKKAFDAFFPLDCGCELTDAVLSANKDDFLEICTFATFDKFVNILFVKKDMDTNECTLSAVHLVSGISEGLILSRNDNALRISWCENGLVMTTTNSEEHRWSPPKKYIRGATCENVLYHIEGDAESFSTYGYMQDGRITLYNTRDMLDLPPKRTSAASKAATKQNSAEKSGANTMPNEKRPSAGSFIPEHKPAEFVKRSVYLTDMAAVRKLLAGQNDVVVEMLKKITALEQAMREKEEILNQITKNTSPDALLEDPDQIDRLAAENLKSTQESALG